MGAVSYIKCGWLIDGFGGPVQESVLLTVAGGQIVSILPTDKDLLDSSADIIDLSACTILPPLVDCHLHLSMSATTDR